MKMEVNKFLSFGQNIDTNFNNIRNNEEYQSLLENTKNKKIKYPKLKFVMYTLSVILITVFSTLLVDKYLINNNGAGRITFPGKINLVERGYVDKIICFGPEKFAFPYKENLILNSNIINEQDKEVFNKYIEEQNKLTTKDKNRFIIYFVIKDGKDIIRIDDINPVDNGMETFYFESNLNYSFESIINDLEIMTNTKFSDDFLNSEIDVYDGIVGDMNSITLVKGILLDFNLNDEGIYVPYYKVIIDDKVYVLNK